MKKITSFCIGSFDGTALFFENEEDFIMTLKEKILEAEENGREQFDVTIEQTEC